MPKLLLKLKKYLGQAYPFYYRGRDLLFVILVLFFMVLGFNYLFRPFHVNYEEHRFSYFSISLVHSITPVVVLLLMSALLQAIGQKERQWSMKSELIFIVTFLLLTGVGQWLIRDLIYDNPLNWTLSLLLEEVRNTFLVGMLFALFIIPMNLNRLKAKHISQAEQLSREAQKGDQVELSELLILEGPDHFEIFPDRFIYARSEGNYLEIYIENSMVVEKNLLRLPIKSLEKQFKDHTKIIRVHRSYMVNLNKVTSVKGNAQGYRLELEGIAGELPVSRSYLPVFNSLYS